MHVAAVARRPPSYTVKLLERVLFCCPTVASRATAVTGTDGRWSCCLLRVRGCRRTGTLPLSTKTRRRKDIELDDDLIPSSVRQANKLLRRHLLRAQTLRAKAAGWCAHVDEQTRLARLPILLLEEVVALYPTAHQLSIQFVVAIESITPSHPWFQGLSRSLGLDICYPLKNLVRYGPSVTISFQPGCCIKYMSLVTPFTDTSPS